MIFRLACNWPKQCGFLPFEFPDLSLYWKGFPLWNPRILYSFMRFLKHLEMQQQQQPVWCNAPWHTRTLATPIRAASPKQHRHGYHTASSRAWQQSNRHTSSIDTYRSWNQTKKDWCRLRFIASNHRQYILYDMFMFFPQRLYGYVMKLCLGPSVHLAIMQLKGISSGHTVSAVNKPLALGRREGMCSKQFLQKRWKLNGFWQGMENGSLGFRYGSDCVLITSNLTCSWAIQALLLSSMIRILINVACLVTGRRLLVDLHRLHIPVGLRSGLLKCLRLSCIRLASLLRLGFESSASIPIPTVKLNYVIT